MLPNVHGFHWTPGHLIFLGVFFAVVIAVATTLAIAAWRAIRDFKRERIESIRWSACFHELPERDRACRHQVTGEFRHRVCEKGFDCRECTTHARLVEAHPPSENAVQDTVSGLSYPLDRMYHRGHTWVHVEPDGTLAVGLDDLAKRLVGSGTSMQPIARGARLHVNGIAWAVRRAGDDARILSPVDGEVVDVIGSGAEQVIKVRPAREASSFVHLLRGSEVGPWVLRELERLQLVLSPGAIPSLADGGILMPDLPAEHPNADWSSVWGEIFLEV